MFRFTLLAIIIFGVMNCSYAGPRVLYVGSFTGTTISIFYIDDNGNLTPKGTVVTGNGTTWFSTSNGILYSTNEQANGIESLEIDKNSGNLKPLNQETSYGGAPTFLTNDKAGKFLFVANYNSGSVVVFSITGNGAIGGLVDLQQHTGHGKDPIRQDGPHAHQIILDANNDYAFSADLGVDKVYIYKFSKDTGQLVPSTPPFVESDPGDGPRHMAFHPSGRFAYLVCELSSTIISFKYHNGTLTYFQRQNTLPVPQAGNYPAEIIVHPSGLFVYVSNRGNDSISIFSVNQQNGSLILIDVHPVGGSYPRGMILDETHKVIYTMNQNSGTVTAHNVEDTGHLKFKGIVANNLKTPVSGLIIQL